MGTDQSNAEDTLIDRFGRHIRYVRLSITDRCDMRCVYCMAEDMTFLPRNQILTLEEIARLGRAFVELGVTKIRLTGGEPLRRRNVMWLVEELGRLPGLEELVLTTNGSRLAELAEPLRAAGVSRINISLDTLRPERFKRITRFGTLDKTLAGIAAAGAAGFKRLKLNTVVLRDMNHDEVRDLAQFALERDMDISYIEEMPLGVIGDHDRAAAYFSSDEVLQTLAADFELLPTTESTGGPSRYYRAKGYTGRIGVISPHSHNFCADCNRVRVTTEGQLLLCLGREESLDLRAILRRHPGDDERLRQAIITAMRMKPAGHRFETGVPAVIGRRMNVTGG